MKKSKIILTIFFVIAGAAVLYFVYGVAKNRYLGTKTESFDLNGSETQDQTGDQAVDQSADNLEDNAPADIPTAVENGQPVFENADCNNDCARFKDNPDGLKYCQEACGDRPVSVKDSESQCENLAGLEKDSCWRDLAVSKKDFAVCDKISDAKLKKVCKNRVTEEVLN